MKQRFSAFDARCIVAELKKLVGMRVANVYDINSKTYLLKFARPDEKVFVLLESGIRVHTTQFARDKNTLPSGFSMKIRKHIRTKRLTSVDQLGIDRAIDFKFGENEFAFHLIIELYAGGNIILTDFEYTILTLLRVVSPNEEVRFAVKENYNIELARQFSPLTQEKLLELLKSSNPQDSLKKILNNGFDYGPAIIDHCVCLAELKPGITVSQLDCSENSQEIQRLLQAFEEANKIIEDSINPQKGYIFLKPGPKGTTGKIYDEFHPYLFKQYEKLEHIEYPSYNEAVDTYFSSMEEQKIELKAQQQELQAIKKLGAIKNDHEKRIRALETLQESNIRKAQLIEENLPLVDAAIQIIRSALAQSLQWDEVKELVDEEKKQGHPVANIIHQLKFETNQMTLLLNDWLDNDSDNSDIDYDEEDDEDEDEDEEKEKSKQTKKKENQGKKPTKVDIDLSQSAYGNSRSYYDNVRSSALKQQKTIEVSKKAMVSAEKKINKEIHQVKVSTSINKIRKPYWFEKFLWFISSENYLVIGGRDMQQNELLVKRYLKKGDAYVHADLNGASSVIVKNIEPNSTTPISPITLAQAGAMAMCQSAAWDAKVVTSAWWVHSHQVSKTAPTGEYLTTGSFMIRGKKNFLPPTQLVMGFGILFRLEETCIARHLGERKTKIDMSDLQASTMGLTIDHEKYGLQTEGNQGSSSGKKEIQTKDKSKVENGDLKLQEIKQEEEEEEHYIVNPSGATTLGVEENQSESENEENEESQGNNEEKSQEDENEEEEEEDTKDDETKDDSESDSDDERGLFPDTMVSLNAQRPINSSPFSSSSDLQEKSTLEKSNSSSSTSLNTSKPRSAAEKRLAKKAAQRGISIEEMEQRKAEALKEQTQRQEAQPEQKTVSQSTNIPRGKKGKLKKMKEKYADQDEEERQWRMEILASSKPQEPKSNQKGNKKQNPQNKNQQTKPVQQNQGKNSQQPGQQNKSKEPQTVNSQQKETQENEKSEEIKEENQENQENQRNNQVDSQDKTKGEQEKSRRAQARQMKKQEEEEVKQLLAEENITLLDDEEMSNLSLLDTLTGKPFPDDLLLFGVPVCAPYSALMNYKYKLKLTPGSMKKGKASQTSIHMFLHSQDITDREKDLIKSIPEPELIAAMMGKVKISTPNLEKVKAATKSANKKKAKGKS